jgi:hypothetical protein
MSSGIAALEVFIKIAQSDYRHPEVALGLSDKIGLSSSVRRPQKVGASSLSDNGFLWQ